MREFAIVGAALIGILAGWIAEEALGREHGLSTNLVVGVVGAFLGAFIANPLNLALPAFGGGLSSRLSARSCCWRLWAWPAATARLEV
jgi:uncharacterized membrane protein YeaQ/YmgE (transglycosylase-associated protein family)